jgi:enoyl-CoA hydratase
MGGAFTSDVLSIDRDGSVATLWLDRPEAGNAMGPPFWSDLPPAMADLSSDDEIRAVVLAARGRHFSVGLDLRALDALLADERAGLPDQGAGADRPRSAASRARSARGAIRRLQAAVNSVADCTKPTIAAVHGSCIGGGVDLIAACDIRLASADAVFSVREARVAIVADLGSLQRLPRIVGAGHVAELAYTGKDIGADRAHAIGLVNAVHQTADATVDAARAMASEIATNSPLAVQGAKAVLSAGDGLTVAQGLDYVATWNAAMLASDDLAEAVAAFMEKRPARYTGT